MNFLKPIFVVVAWACLSCAATAQPMVDAKYGRSFFPLGKFLKIGGLAYTTKGAELIEVPGEIGNLLGTTGITAPFSKNHFKRIQVLDGVATVQGREFQIDRDVLTKIKGDASGNTDQIPGLDDSASAEAKASYDRNGTQFSKYVGLFWQVEDWLAVEQKIRDMTPDEQRRLSDKTIRIVEAVLYATGFNAGSGVTISAGGSVDATADKVVEFSATLDGEKTENVKLSLADRSPIAYSYRMLCWNGTVFDKTMPDEIGAGRPSGCGNYKAN